MLLTYQNFYKFYGIRRAQQIISPRLFQSDIFTFPKDSILHYVSHDPNNLVPDPNNTYFVSGNRKIQMDHIDTMTGTMGNPRRNSILLNNLVRSYHIKNKHFRYTRDAVDTIKDPMSLIVLNYGYLQKLYKYVNAPLTDYYKWHNIEQTLWDTLNRVTKVSMRQNYIFVNIPEIIPSLTSLRTYAVKTNISIYKVFDTSDKLSVLEIWKWIGEDTRDQSMISVLSKDQLHKVNLVLDYKGYWTVLNLGLFDSYRESKDEEKSETIQFTPFQMQKYLLRMMMHLQSVNADASLTEEHQELKETNRDDANVSDSSSAGDESEQMSKDEDTANVPAEYGNTYVSTKYSLFNKDVSTSNPPDIQPEEYGIADEVNMNIDKDIEALEYIEKQAMLAKDTLGEEKHTTLEASEENIVASRNIAYTEKSSEEMLKIHMDKHASYGLLSASDYRQLVDNAEQFANSGAPYDPEIPVKEYIKIKQEDLKIDKESTRMPDNDQVLDKSMLYSSISNYDNHYLKNIMPKNMVSIAHHIQRSGVVVQEYTVETQSSITDNYEIHSLRIKPIDGVPSTIRYKLPKINDDGEFIIGGNKYRLRKQRGDIPIRKINDRSVGLTSYYGKIFVDRSAYKINDPMAWLYNQIMRISMMESIISDTATANVFDNYFKAPRIYSGLSMYFKGMTINGITYTFDHKERMHLFSESTINQLESNKYRVVGNHQGTPILVGYDDVFYQYKDGIYHPMGDIYHILNISRSDSPLDYTELSVFNKSIPVGIILGYLMGFKKVLHLLNIVPRVYDIKQKVELEDHEYILAFKDRKLVLSRNDRLATLILGGYNAYRKIIKNYFLDSFDDSRVYFNILETNNISVRYIREVELMNELFIDPITRDVLVALKEPQTFIGLLMRSTELLISDDHPDSQDTNYVRFKGYERFAGAVYREIINSIREYKTKSVRGKSQIEMNPYAVWMTINQDPSKMLVSDINPIQHLKETEDVTYSGVGGRKKDTMNKLSRAYHPNDMGTISEATKDSADVGINTYFSANPKLTNVYGLTERYDPATDSATNILSTSALLAPAADKEDVKRTNFISIMASHTVACDGYHQPYVRTGYEQLIAHRTNDLYAYTAKKNGRVVSLNDKGIIIEYIDGERKGIQLGRRYGHAEGSTYPHDIITPLKSDDVFRTGDVIAYNTGFFEPDMLNPKHVVWKSSMVVKTLLYESSQTLEDSSAISSKVSKMMSSKTTKVRSFVIKFNQGIRNILPYGTSLTPDDILFTIEDEVTNESGIFDETTLGTLRKLANFTPRAKYNGVLDKIEVRYSGSKDDMSPTLKALADRSDSELMETRRSIGEHPMTGQVTEDYYVNNDTLEPDTAELKVYITVNNTAGVGDKGIFSNQLKSIIGEVLDYDIKTESGETIDAIFGRQSIAARVVESADIIGTTTTLLKVIARKAVEIYKS